jgi:UDP-N-acetylglucosamine 2-epimerase (non-hydrolysing)
MRVLSVFGTRPEAIKLAPVLLALNDEPAIDSFACVTGQHRALLDGVLGHFGIAPDFDLDLMIPGQGLNGLLVRAVERLDAVIAEAAPDRVLVQGDTTSALAAALAAFHRGVPVAHVEAGLRTYRPASPFPEETNRRAIALVSDLHFAPTPAARANLEAERLHGEVFVTGNTGIDALLHVVGRLGDPAFAAAVERDLPAPNGGSLVLVTCHRRESFGAPFAAICAALAELGRRGMDIVFPLHPNPALSAPAQALLAGRQGVRLLPPLALPAFIRLMQRADVILTDSGGVQEEAATLGKPAVVLRDVTERPEGVAAGAARLAGADPAAIVAAALAPARFTGRRDLYGDGRAAPRVVDALLGREVDEFAPGDDVTEAAE